MGVKANGEVTKIGDCETDSGGFMWVDQGDGDQWIIENYRSCCNGFFPGEPFKYVLSTEDRSEFWECRLVPIPLVAVDSFGRRADLYFTDNDRTQYQLELSNFHPKEKCSFVSTSGEEVITNRFEVSASGKAVIGVQPAVIGQKFGKARIEILTDSSK